ncbi:hypothetical protein HOH87_03060 [bacterium]|jgi:flagellar basal body rod protein FlgG|nr:hypothetical protein [bacterium]
MTKPNRLWIILGGLLATLSVALPAAEHNPLPFEEYDNIVNPTLKLATASMGGFFDAMKSYIVYSAYQNVPGTKESGVGYYYNNQTKEYKRVLFYRIGNGYPEESYRSLDVYVDNSSGFFVIELPGGWKAYTKDGRFEMEKDGRLVTHNERFPVLGENGHIYVPSNEVDIDVQGVITYNGQMIDTIRIDILRDKTALKSFNHKIFYYDLEDMENDTYLTDGTYMIMQGYYEASTITKGYIGLVPEWQNGHEAQVKIIKAYVKNMQASVQVANPQ